MPSRTLWPRSVLAAAWLLGVGVPLDAQTPEQRYSEWAAMDFPPEEYVARRSEAAVALRAAGGGTLLVPSSEGLSDGETFRQDDDFWYFTGLELPRSLLAIEADGGVRLFAPERDFRFENPSRRNDFPGRPLATDPELAQGSGLEGIEPASGLEAYLARLAESRTSVFVHASPSARERGLFGTAPNAAAQLVEYWRSHFSSTYLRSAASILARTRGIKTARELERVRASIELTESAILEGASAVTPGVSERDLEAAFVAACLRGGAQRVAFHPIIKSGPNSLWPWRILASHYNRRNRQLENGDLVIFDVGCELDHYQSDVGRTFPVSGRFTPEQRTVLEMQVRVVDHITAAVRPGVTFADLRRVAYEAIPDEAEPYMQVGLFFGHAIGLSTGDPFEAERPLQPGMVFTVEPWYYNHDTGISVFTEDVLAVTPDGVEILSASLPRSPEALERLVGGRSR